MSSGMDTGDGSDIRDTIRASNMPGLSATAEAPQEEEDPRVDYSPSLAPLLEEELAIPSILKESELIAPTASFESVKSPPAHKRNISWGQNEVFPSFPLPISDSVARQSSDQSASKLQKPFRTRGYSDASEITMDNSLLRTESTRKRIMATTNIDEITLDDVRMAHPREGEAVSYILRALEEMEPPEATVFPNLPDEAVDSFTTVQSAISETSSIGSEPTLRSRHASPRQRKNMRQVSVRGLHKRTGTMEQQLFGLTAAIDALQQENWNHPLEEQWKEEGTDTNKPLGSADAIQQNASILYNRASKTKKHRRTGSESYVSEPSSISSNTGKESLTKWRKVRDAVRTGFVTNAQGAEEDGVSKKSDDREEAIDEESGVSSDPASLNDNTDTRNNQPQPNVRSRKEQLVVFHDFNDYLKPQMKSLRKFIRSFVLFIVVPLLAMAAILFYAAGNPSAGVLINGGKPVNGTLINTEGDVVSKNQASVSWWLLFVLRQLLTGVLAKATELFLIDFLSMRSQGLVHLFGPWLTLLLMQSRGWPFVAFTWSIFDFILLAGNRPFYSHWMFYQSTIQLFNESNPSGGIVDSAWNYRILAIVASVSAVVSIKRMWLGLYLGRQTFRKLTSVMRKTLLITEVAALARKLQKYSADIKSTDFLPPVLLGAGASELEALMNNVPDESSAGGVPSSTRSTKSDGQGADFVVDSEDRHPLTGALSAQQQARITQLLGAWEEPHHVDKANDEGISINAILQFRRALACLNTPFLFSNAFGLANTRSACVESSQNVYHRLSAHNGDEGTLSFQLLALLGVEEGGGLDQTKLKELIRLFRPERDGSLDTLAFVKSIDQVYREIRLLRASVANSSKIDRAFENIINIGFYVVVFTIVVASLGFDPLAIFLSISGVVLAFAFMISSASSKYFEGLLFILVRRPYQIGDAIHVSNVETDTSYTGSAWWTVEDVGLFTTKVVFAFTMERASLSNGSLANSRIINSTESTEPYVWTTLKFPIDVTFEKLQIFQKALEEFVKNRPREFLSYLDFRVMQVEVDRGSMSYLVGAQHRSTWAEWTQIMLSKADLILFCVELQKKLGIFYKTPPLPVDLSMGSLHAFQEAQRQGPTTMEDSGNRTDGIPREMSSSPDISGLQALFPPRSPR